MDYNRGGLLHYSRLGKSLQYQLVKEKKKKGSQFSFDQLRKKRYVDCYMLCLLTGDSGKKIECVPFFASLWNISKVRMFDDCL